MIKRLLFIVLSMMIVFSCATQKTTTGKEREIALATQRVGEQYYNTGKFTQALKKLLEAYEILPESPQLNNSLGLVYLAKERYDLAKKHFNKALSLQPDLIEAQNNLGATYLKTKEWDKAIQIFENVSENLLYDTPEVPLTNLGWAYYHQKIYGKAKNYFLRALEYRPSYLVPIHGLATVYTETGYHSLAIEYLTKQLNKAPDAVILHSDLAKAYEASKQPEKARGAWETVLMLAPPSSLLSKEAQKRLDSLQ